MMMNRLFTRSFATSIRSVGVVGAGGLMGHGIAQVAATSGYNVVAVDSKDDALTLGKKRIQGSLDKVFARAVTKKEITEEDAKRQISEINSKISYTTHIEDVAQCDLVIEAIVENMDIKGPFYRKLGQLVKPEGILASNTSSLSITAMAEASGRPARVVGLHFFNPVQVMKLVEVVRTKYTDEAVFNNAKSWVVSLKKDAVSCNDTPGFIVNRLLVPAMAQALLMYDRGDGTIEDIDTAMRLGASHPMGPITLADYVGLDTVYNIISGWVKNYPNEPAFVMPRSLGEKVKAGKLGRKSGEGFYKWQGDKPIEVAR